MDSEPALSAEYRWLEVLFVSDVLPATRRISRVRNRNPPHTGAASEAKSRTRILIEEALDAGVPLDPTIIDTIIRNSSADEILDTDFWAWYSRLSSSISQRKSMTEAAFTSIIFSVLSVSLFIVDKYIDQDLLRIGGTYISTTIVVISQILGPLCFGALGASLSYLFHHVSNAMEPIAYNRRIFAVRICLGALFGLVVGLPFYEKGNYYYVIPFLSGYSVIIVTSLLNRLIEVLQNAISQEHDDSLIELTPRIFFVGLLMFIVGISGSVWTALHSGENALPYAALMAIGATTGALSLLSGRTSYGEGQASEPGGRSSVIPDKDVRSAS